MLNKGRLLACVAAAVLAGCAEAGRSDAPAGDLPGGIVHAGLETASPAETPAPPTLPGTAPAVDLEIAPAPALATARYHHTATRLADGSVLVFGGEAASGSQLGAAERFDPAAGVWTAAGTGGAAPDPRTRHTATLLPDGRVLIAGGFTNGTALWSAELYDPATDAFRIIAGRLRTARYGHTASLLPDGAVVIAGGYDGRGLPLASCERIDPATGTIELLPLLLSPARAFHTATTLPDGRVLLAGGLVSQDRTPVRVTPAAELLTPPAEAGAEWAISATAGLRNGRAVHTATLVRVGDRDGLVLLAGGTGADPDPAARDDAEIFDPAQGPAGDFETVEARMAVARSGHTATGLPDGSVLVIGGATAPHPDLCPVTVGIERFVPDALGQAPGAPYGGLAATALFVQPVDAAGTPVGLPETAQGLTAHAAVLLSDGRVLVAGGADCAFATPVAVARTAIATATPAR